MSGSYDKKSGRPSRLPPHQSPQFEYDDVFTGAPQSSYDYDTSEARYSGPVEPPIVLEAPERREGARPNIPDVPARVAEKANAPIVPAGSVTGRSLTLVITIMCFLACLTAGAVYIMNQSAEAWLKDIASEATVQVEPAENVDLDKLVTDVATFLRNQTGIRAVSPLDIDASAKLLEPWLGQTDLLKSLPVPRLIALELDRGTPPDFEALRKTLKQQFSDRVSLDDHRHWQTQIRTVTRSFALGGFAILLLVGAATTAIIVSATRSALASNRGIVEVLHFVGATDRFIAREFEQHFLQLGIRAGLVGAVSAIAVFLLMPAVMQVLGGGSVSTAEMQRLVGSGNLDFAGYVLLSIVVVVIAALCMLTSRFGVYRILNSQH